DVTEAAEWNLFDEVLNCFFGHAFAHPDVDEAGRDSVHGNVLTCKLPRGDFGKRNDRRFARRIICLTEKSHLPADGRQIYDAATVAQNRSGLLRDGECAGEIHSHDALEFFHRHLLDRAVADDSGIVHENIETAALVADLHHHRFDLLRLCHVALDHERVV